MASPFAHLREWELRLSRLAGSRSTALSGTRAAAASLAALLSLLAVLALALAGAVPALSPQAAAVQPDEMDRVSSGRVNLFHLYGTDPETRMIGLGMTVDNTPVAPETTLISVPGAAAPITDPALVAAGATSGWTVAPGGPLTLGWDATGVASAPFLYDGSNVRLSWTGPQGAKVFLAQPDPSGQTANLTSLLRSGSLELAPGVGPDDEGVESNDVLQVGRQSAGQAEVAPLTGAATWVFTQPGTYVLTATAYSASTTGLASSAQTQAVTYTIQVGESAPQPEEPVVEPATQPTTDPVVEPTTEPTTPTTEPTVEPTTEPTTTPSAPATTARTAPAAPAPGTNACALLGNTDGFETVLDHGHVDMFDLTSDASGNLSLLLKEDVTGHGVLHDPSTVLLSVKENYTVPGSDGKPAREESTYTTLPQDLRNQIPSLPTAGYVLDANGTDQAHIVWPGWDTLSSRQGGYTGATFEVGYTGPENGTIHAFAGGSLLGLESVLSDGGYALNPAGSVITQPYPAHKHVTWVFSHAGRYVLTVKATATKDDGTAAQTSEQTYTIDVGERSSCVTPAAPKQPGTAQQSGARTALRSAGEAAAPTNVVAAQDPSNVVAAPAASVPGAGNSRAGGAGSAGASRAAASGQCVATTITREATEEEAARLAGSNASSGSSGATANSATTTLTFQVGPGATGTATEGHFDLGPAIEDGTLVARIKDDRSQPASWVAPESLTFALGDAAAIQAPAALSFVANQGQTVWMIPSTQIAGVPWLGMNSQREEIVNGTKGGVTFSLDAVSGPGRVAVFNAGALGGGVGEHVFDGAGSAYHLPANTHAHQNWVFTEPGTYTLTLTMTVTPTGADLKGSTSGAGGAGGADAAGTLTLTGEKGPGGRPMVKEVVGRTPDGKPCDLNLARTGTDSGDIVLASTALVMAGLVLVAARRRKAVTA
ncbi:MULTISPECIES: TIGR03773 family transporter-associated surface protein [Actinomyces]|uniref:TIGR03773 family transporter-associated surface protein n=1 Tax=Actinomyces TaxID=1654 RepID=UPI001FBB6ADF|nr:MULTISPECIES: TIGR03773 family transporter-associated surface protein [Actinomyces]